jgi:hypothetical protein
LRVDRGRTSRTQRRTRRNGEQVNTGTFYNDSTSKTCAPVWERTFYYAFQIFAKKPGIVKGPQLLDFHSGFDDMCVKTDENRRFSYRSRFAARKARLLGKACKTSKKPRDAGLL